MPQSGSNQTWASKIFLKLCTLADCTSLDSIKKVIDRYDCTQINCDLAMLYKENGIGVAAGDVT